MLALTIFSGMGILVILLVFIFGNSDRDMIPTLFIGLILLIVVFTITLTFEIDAKNKLEITERTIVTDYLKVNMYTTLKFSEPIEIKIVEYDYPDYSLLNDDKTIYEVMK